MQNIEKLIDIAKEAGKKILEIYDGDFGYSIKEDQSPLTLADKESHKYIFQELTQSFPEIPILSEEGADIPYSIRKNWNELFLVDPLDGTKEFIKKNGEFTVNIAYIRDNYPVASVIHAPVLDTSYYAIKNQGAFKKEGTKPVKKITVDLNSDINNLIIILSRSHAHNENLTEFLKLINIKDKINVGSSLKLCILAESKAHLYPRFGPTSEWDIASGQCILEEAGGYVVDFKGKRLSYNKENILNPFFIAGFNKDHFEKNILDHIKNY